MAYVRYKLPDPTHQLLKKLAKRLGMKESEISRLAIMQYMKDVGVISDRVHKHRIRDKFSKERDSNHLLLTKLIKDRE